MFCRPRAYCLRSVVVAVAEILVKERFLPIVRIARLLLGFRRIGHAVVVVAVILENLAVAFFACDARRQHLCRNHVSAAVVAQVEYQIGDSRVAELPEGIQQVVVICRVEPVVDHVADLVLTLLDDLRAEHRVRVEPFRREGGLFTRLPEGLSAACIRGCIRSPNRRSRRRLSPRRSYPV